MLLLGVLQAQAAGAGPVVDSDFDLLETQVLDSVETSVVFSSLAATYGADYQHLQIRATTRVTSATTLRMNRIRFNGDTTSNYSTHQLIGDSNAANPYAGAGVSLDGMLTFYGTGNSSTSGAFGAGVIDILDPFETTKYTTHRSFGGQFSYSIVNLASGSWRNTDALTSITIYPENSDSYAIGSRFSLYGVKGSA